MALFAGNLLSENDQSVETSVGNWSSYSDLSSAIVQSNGTSEPRHDGLFSVKCTKSATAAPGAMCGITGTGVPVTTAATLYTFQFLVFTATASCSFYTFVDWYQTNNTTYISSTDGVSSPVSATQNAWTLVRQTHTSPALGTRARVYCMLNAGLSTGGIAYFDEIFFGVPSLSLTRKPVSLLTAVNRTSTW